MSVPFLSKYSFQLPNLPKLPILYQNSKPIIHKNTPQLLQNKTKLTTNNTKIGFTFCSTAAFQQNKTFPLINPCPLSSSQWSVDSDNANCSACEDTTRDIYKDKIKDGRLTAAVHRRLLGLTAAKLVDPTIRSVSLQI